MDSSIGTEDVERAGAVAAADAGVTAETMTGPQPDPLGGRTSAHRGAGSGDEPTTEIRAPLVSPIREQCSACGSAMAADQRYCVECGHRRGPPRVPQLDAIAQRAAETAPSRRPHRGPRVSANTTLLAGIGTLLLALGVGVLIGRSGNGSSAKAPPAQVVTVAGGGTAGTASTTPTASQPATTKAAHGSEAASKAAAKAAVRKAAAKLQVVTVGSPGKGRGYQHGHFTGNFFGPEAEEK
jgi:hypothetical protein